ncbi:hypothetical protein P7C70_g7736, partial [Phenoliferia sp. Uapishka_3]
MSGTQNVVAEYESAPVDYKGLPAIKNGDIIDKKALGDAVEVNTTIITNEGGDGEGRPPTEEEKLTLRLIPAAMPWAAVMMCLIEFAERASYYGSYGVFANFIENPLPIGGNGAGAVAKGALGRNESAGALGMGSQTSSAITVLFTFLVSHLFGLRACFHVANLAIVLRLVSARTSLESQSREMKEADTSGTDCIPILGGIIADTKWGRFKTIAVGAVIGAVSHVLLVIPAIPSVIRSGNALGPFVLAIIILAFASGFIKPCLSPLLCDQNPVKTQTVITLKSGENVIVDPATTISRYMLIFYFAINIGAFFQLATTYAEHDIGYWLAFLLPGIIYSQLKLLLESEDSANVVSLAFSVHAPDPRLPLQAFVQGPASGIGSRRMRLCRATPVQEWRLEALLEGRRQILGSKPSNIEAREGPLDTSKVFWDDKFVDELRQSFSACKVFLLIPIFALADGGIGNSENAMSTAMITNGVPNDLISNFNSVRLTIVVFAPLMNYLWYPWMRKMGYPLKPMTRMAIVSLLDSKQHLPETAPNIIRQKGFVLGGINMIIGAILQWRVYKTSPCGYYATSDCAAGVSSISLWAQIPLYALPAIGEIFVNVTSYEIAYTRAPARMKGLVYAMVLFTQALASALAEICNPSLKDPYLIWPYVGLASLMTAHSRRRQLTLLPSEQACACFLAATVFPTVFKDLNEPVEFGDVDRMEGKLQPKALLEGTGTESAVDEKKLESA